MFGFLMVLCFTVKHLHFSLIYPIVPEIFWLALVQFFVTVLEKRDFNWQPFQKKALISLFLILLP